MKLVDLKSKGFCIPTALFVAFVVVQLVLFQTGHRKYYTLTGNLIQWDAEHYLSIARDGYEKFPCAFDAGYICGNIGWFPFYPMTTRAVASIGLGTQTALILVSWLSLWLALLILYRLVAKKFDPRVGLYSLVALLLFPGSFYYLTGFPYSLYLLLAVSIFYLLESNRLWGVIPLTACLAVTYPSGAVIGLPILSVLVSKWKKTDSKYRLTLVAGLASIGLALMLYFAYYWLEFGDFFLYMKFQAQSYYAHRMDFPLLVMARTLSTQSLARPECVTLIFTVSVVSLFYRRRIPISWQIFMFGILLFTPTMGTTTCYYRHIIVAFPMFVMIADNINARRRRYALAVYAAAAIYLNLHIFVSTFKDGVLM
jgi:hypothetical protein